MDLIKKNSKVVIGIGAIVVVALLILVVALVPSKQVKECKLQSKYDWDRQSGLKNLPTPDFKNLVNFVGALHVQNGTDGYLPIILDSASAEFQNRTYKLKMDSDCSNLTFEVQTYPVSEVLRVTSIEVEANTGKGMNKICKVQDPKIVFSTFTHYECATTIVIDCKTDLTDPKYKLIVDHISIELDGNPGKIRNGEFSKKAELCF